VRAIKRALDPHGILNPGKTVPSEDTPCTRSTSAKNYSSWSLRGWLVTKLSGAPFREVMVSLRGEAAPNPENRAFSPSARVPCLHDGDTIVWDSLAIAEYLAERHPGMWPLDPVARAFARSACAEMHSGFGHLRNEMTMCIKERVDVRPWSPGLAADIARVAEIWTESRRRFGAGGPYLAGAFGIADAFYAPVSGSAPYEVSPDGAAGVSRRGNGAPCRQWGRAARARRRWSRRMSHACLPRQAAR
jgi:glutathione S-transferase